MKRQEDIEFQICQLVDGELGEAEAGALRERITREPGLAELHRLYASLDEKLTVQATRGLNLDWDVQRHSIQGALERDALLKPPRAFWVSRMLRPVAAVAAVAAVLAVAVMVVLPILNSPQNPGGPPTGLQPGELTSRLIAPPAVTGGRLLVTYSERGQRPSPAIGQLEQEPAYSTTVVMVGALREDRRSSEGSGSFESLFQ